MIYNSKQDGNAVFHIANISGHPEIINVPLKWVDDDMLKVLLQTDKLGILDAVSPTGRKYIFLVNGNLDGQYPSVMIWRYEDDGIDRKIVDVEQEDFAAVTYVVENYLQKT